MPIPWGNEASPMGVRAPKTNQVGYSGFSSGPLIDPTPHDHTVPVFSGGLDSDPRIPTMEFQGPSIDSYQMSSQGPPYENTSATDESSFSKLEHKLAHEKGVTNPAGLAAKIGREKLGESEMTRRSKAGREHNKE